MLALVVFRLAGRSSVVTGVSSTGGSACVGVGPGDRSLLGSKSGGGIILVGGACGGGSYLLLIHRNGAISGRRIGSGFP